MNGTESAFCPSNKRGPHVPATSDDEITWHCYLCGCDLTPEEVTEIKRRRGETMKAKKIYESLSKKHPNECKQDCPSDCNATPEEYPGGCTAGRFVFVEAVRMPTSDDRVVGYVMLACAAVIAVFVATKVIG